ncbi:MAG: glycosyltransferase, partial [Planctomycetia bacterium]|nr:glycosyltransferase [Planctomycetia bacterium]
NTGGVAGNTRKPTVLQPIMLPWFRRKWQRRVNRFLLVRQLSRVLDGEENVTAITTLPITADLVGALPMVARWVYYCVDDWSRWPGMDAKPLAEMETQMVPCVDRIVTVGEKLRDRIRTLGRDSLLLTHGVDLDFWRLATENRNVSENGNTVETLSETLEEREFSRDMTRPILVFWGLIDERLDLTILERLAADMPEATILFAGPTAAPEVLQRLTQLLNFRYVGSLPYEKLPILASEADVLLMPYLKNEATEQIQPLKMTEYLASGKPAVVRDLKASEIWWDALDVADSAEEFSRKVRLRIQTGLPPEQSAARERLKSETWEEKARMWEEYMMK